MIDLACSCHHERLVLLPKLGITKTYGSVEILAFNGLGDLLSIQHRFHKGLPDNLVFGDGNEASLGLGGGFQDSLDGLNTLQGREHSVICDGGTTALNVAEGGDTGIEGEAILVGEKVSYLFGGNLVSKLVESTLSDNDDGLALSTLAVLLFPFVSHCLFGGTVAQAEHGKRTS